MEREERALPTGTLFWMFTDSRLDREVVIIDNMTERLRYSLSNRCRAKLLLASGSTMSPISI